MLHLDSFDPLDRRPDQRTRVARELDRLIAELQRDYSSHLVLRGLVDAAQRLHRHLQTTDPIVPRGRV